MRKECLNPSQPTSDQTLAVMGAGPKGIALACKAAALYQLGLCVPKVKIFEPAGIGAHWKARTGYTNGKLHLGTSPEKDVGFPYASNCWGDEINHQLDDLMRGYSWQSYLVDTRAYSTWIDRGRPSPEHRAWAKYLEWVFTKVQKCPVVELVTSEIVGLDIQGENWILKSKSLEGVVKEEIVHGFVSTGPGVVRLPSDLPQDERVMTIKNFWCQLEELARAPLGSHVAVVGNGETAATTAVALARMANDLRIDIITPSGMSYSRGESFEENHMYTDPLRGNWHQMTYQDRRNFIERTDRGVFSVSTKRELDHIDRVEIIPGWFRKVSVDYARQLVVDLEYNGIVENRVYDFVVLSVGFDPVGAVTKLMGENTLDLLRSRADLPELNAASIEKRIEEDIAIKGLRPKLHLPMLAALEQGPGLPNLSCLGRLSDQILVSYVSLDGG